MAHDANLNAAAVTIDGAVEEIRRAAERVNMANGGEPSAIEREIIHLSNQLVKVQARLYGYANGEEALPVMILDDSKAYGDGPPVRVLGAVMNGGVVREEMPLLVGGKTLPNRCREAADKLQCAFTWAKTPEGHKYWATVWHRLHEMAEEQDRKEFLKVDGITEP